MAFLVDQFGRPPEERWDLFHQYYELICRREIERDIATSLVIRELKPRIDSVHRLVGLLLQSESERSGGTRSRLTLSEFRKIVSAVLTSEGFHGTRLEKALTDIELAAADRLVFLVGLEEGEVGFEVRSLQEFMAGEALLEANDLLAEKRLTQIAGSDTWANVFLFAAGKCFKERQYFRSTIVHICNKLNDDPADHGSRMMLLGSRLALSVLQEGSARRSPIFAIQLTRIALRLIDSPSGRRFAPDLAAVCSADTVHVYREVLGPPMTSRGGRSVASAWACWTGLADLDEIPLSEWEAMVDRNPSLISESMNYWPAISVAKVNQQLIERLAAYLHLHPPHQLLTNIQISEARSQVPAVLTKGERAWKPGLATLISYLQSAYRGGRAERAIGCARQPIPRAFLSRSATIGVIE